MVSEILNIGFSLVDRLAAGKALGLSRQTLLRAYHFELVQNLDLLELVDSAALKGAGVDDPAFAAIVGGLETEIALSILFSDTAPCREAFALLEAAGELEETPEEGGVAAKVRKSALQAMLFTVRKTGALRRAASLRPMSLAREPRLTVRMGNVKQHFEFIEARLRDIDSREPFLIR